MGTLSKSFASCGGYIAGSAAVVEYLRYTTPGFVYSVGMSPANAGAALAAVRVMKAEPDRVSRLQDRADLFRRLARNAGLDIGSSEHSAVVPVIVGGSARCLCLAQALRERGLNVSPIIAPATPETGTRLRFFLTSDHTVEQLGFAVTALAEELARLRP
jgi:7-keto-8-aminopelargonate synthetase-like enzyme